MSAQDDDRFKCVSTDPRFRTLRRKDKTVSIDGRFRSMFKQPDFDPLRLSIDKRGRPLNGNNKTHLEKFYQIEESSDDSDEGDVVASPVKAKSSIPDARGLNDSSSGSSSEDSSDDDDDDDDEKGDGELLNSEWDELDKDAPRSDLISRRLAICNMDWDRVKAVDLFVLINSFKSSGLVLSIKIFPSEYGKERMAKEHIHGPAELVSQSLPAESKSNKKRRASKAPVDQNDEIDVEKDPNLKAKLRQYQLNRLKYFYAIVECDSQDTADMIYKELEGMEYEGSSARMDLRFVPDDVEFEETPTSSANAMPDPATYTPPDFITTALQQGKVTLTWDETDPERTKRFQKAFEKRKIVKNKDEDTDYLGEDLADYLASSSSGEEDESCDDGSDMDNDDGSKVNKYKDLLSKLNAEEDEEDVDVEISWDPQVKDEIERDLKEVETSKNQTHFEKERLKKKAKLETPDPQDDSSPSDDDDDDHVDDEMKGEKPFSDDELPDGIAPDMELDSELSKSQLRKRKRNKAKADVHLSEEDVARQKELELLLMDEGEDDMLKGRKHFNFDNFVDEKKSKKKKRAKRTLANEATADSDFAFDAEDPRFGNLFNNPDFNVDPSDPHFKKTPAFDAIVQKKQRPDIPRSKSVSKKQSLDQPKPQEATETRTGQSELDRLVSSIKSKTATHASARKANK